MAASILLIVILVVLIFMMHKNAIIILTVRLVLLGKEITKTVYIAMVVEEFCLIVFIMGIIC